MKDYTELFYKGSQTPADAKVIVDVLHEYQLRPVSLVEVGILTGQTARGIKAICDDFGIQLDYYGVDPVSPETHNYPRIPFPGATFIQRDSLEAVHSFHPGSLDIVISDGCHCLNHVMLETILFSDKVKPGGWMLFHDTQDDIQGTMRDPHGPDVPEFYNSVNAAHKRLNFPLGPQWNWKQVYRSQTPGHPWGGMTAFKKV